VGLRYGEEGAPEAVESTEIEGRELRIGIARASVSA
jgi:hypothetical protein